MHTDTLEEMLPDPKKRKTIFHWFVRILLGIMILIALFLFALHLPPVQRWGIGKLEVFLSKTLDTRVTIEGFTFDPISDLTLQNIYIGSPDSPGDTLIYARRLSVDYNRLWEIANHRLTISQISLKEGKLNIHRLEDAPETNLDLALSRLLPPGDPNKPGFSLDLRTVQANQLAVNINDENNGTLVHIFLDRADVDIDTLDFPNKFVDLDLADLDRPSIDVINRALVKASAAADTSVSKTWSFDVNQLRLTNGRFSNQQDGRERTVYPDSLGIDYGHMKLTDINISIDSFIVRGWDFLGKDINISARDEHGFSLQRLTADKAHVSADGIIVDRLNLVTPKSAIQNSLALRFSGFTDFQHFPDSVYIDIPSADMIVYINDLLALAPGLQRTSFFLGNKNKNLTLQGNVHGPINHLIIDGFNASAGRIHFVGDFRSNHLTVDGRQEIQLDVKNSIVSAQSLNELFPRIKLPEQLNKLGQVNFTGQFEGNPKDFHAFGRFATGLGGVTLDMNLDILRGIANGNYSGIIGLKDFDLGKLVDQPDLGRVTMSGRVIDGVGLTGRAMQADITGHIDEVEFHHYKYHAADINGRFYGPMFNGMVVIRDPNVDMRFEGEVDFRDSLTRLDFTAQIDSIRFWELGFSKKKMNLSGFLDLELNGKKLIDYTGTVRGEHLALTVGEDHYLLDSLFVLASKDPAGREKSYSVISDVISGNVRGDFNPAKLPSQLQAYLHEKYPGSIPAPAHFPETPDPQHLIWDLEIKDSRNWFNLAGLRDLEIANTNLTGQLDLESHHAHGAIDLPELHYGGINAYGTSMNFTENDGTASVDLDLTAADIKENIFFEDVLISGTATDDSVRMRFTTDDLADFIDEIDMDILADPENGTWNIALQPHKLRMIGEDWTIPAGNEIQIHKNEFSLNHFELVSGAQHIALKDIDHKGIDALIEGFDMSYLNAIWINDKFKFEGKYSLDLEIDDLYNIRHLKAAVHIPELKVNNRPYGKWEMNASMQDPKDSVRIDLRMEHNDTRLSAVGAYLPPIKAIPTADQNYLRLLINTTDFPLDFLEFLIGSNIRDTEGSVNMQLALRGKTNKLEPRGEGRVYNGSTTIDYLGVAYSFHNQKFTITEDMIDLSGVTLYDVLGNTATVEGGITHQYLRNLGLRATISSDQLMGLDVGKDKNNVFYGKGIGSVFARFSGTMANPTMDIKAETFFPTHIYIPITGGARNSDRDFAIFLENGMLPASAQTKINLTGINFNMDLTINPEAIVEIIFDENTGEILRGSGEGNLQLSMSRTGNFSMYGNYKIQSGNYLFTNFVIKKPFEILQGGNIQWDGDPYDATLSVQAKYKGLTAAVYTLIQEYLPTTANSDLINEAKQRTDVDLTMILTGSLLHPDINFNIAFPNLTGELKGYADSKIASLRSNENAMTQQVTGLLVARSFWPTNNTAGVLIKESFNNTLSELIAATLSSYLGGLLGDLIPQGKILTGIDFQLGLDLPVATSGIVDENGNLDDPNKTEVEVQLPLEFFNDRLNVNVGGNYVSGASLAGVKDYFAGDVTFEYQITADRRLKVRAYNRNTYTIEGRKNKVGLGVAYRREYDSFAEFLGLKKKSEKKEAPDSTR